MFSKFRSLIFKFDPETAHTLAIKSLKFNFVPNIFDENKKNPIFQTTLFGKKIDNPIGMAAGFDKNAEVYNSLFKLGFGFVEIGTVTPIKQFGNPRPRVFRLKEDQAVVIFPEGKRNYNGLQKADNSFAKLAIKSNTYILPIGITGTENMQYVTRVFNPTGKITIKFGKPFKIISKNEKITKENMNSINESIMMEIAQLLPPKYQGIYKDKSYKEKLSKNKIFQYYRKDMEKLCVE